MTHSVKSVSLVIVGIFLSAFGIKLLSSNQLTFGGTAGVAVLLSYVSSLSWSFWFLVVNIPFFLLSYFALGRRFTVSTLLSIVGVSLAQQAMELIMDAAAMHPMAASVASGMSIGIGIAFVMNNGSSLGGIQIFALFLDRKFGINRGTTIFVGDAMIVTAAAFLLGWGQALASIVSIAVASYIIGRYKREPASATLPGAPSRAPTKAEHR